jgi:ABC-2 type transport system permease protein
MTVLTRIDPVSYGIDPLRRAVLGGAGVPNAVLDKLGLTLLGSPVPMLEEILILLAIGAVLLYLAVRGFRARD